MSIERMKYIKIYQKNSLPAFEIFVSSTSHEPLLVPKFKKADLESIFKKLPSTNWSDILTTANGNI